MLHIIYQKHTRDYESEEPTTCSKIFSPNHNQPHPSMNWKRQKSLGLWHNRVELQLVAASNQSFYQNVFW